METRRIGRRRFLAMGAASAVGSAIAATLGACTRDHVGPDAVVTDVARRWPAEWERHEATMMAMPHRRQIYGRRLRAVQTEWSALVSAISRFEPVRIVVPSSGAVPISASGKDVELLSLEFDDMWIRDNGPIVVLGGDQGRIGLDWRFDGWGGAFDRFGQTWADDDRLPQPLLAELGVPREPVDMVLEGGAVLSDGAGTILTTRENLLEAGRNPTRAPGQIEAELHARLGTSSVIWLPHGLVGDLTAGHVDGVAAYLGPARVLAQTDPAGGEEGERLHDNLAALQVATDATGRSIDVVEFPLLPRGSFGGTPSSSFTYLNLIFVDGGLLVPTTGDDQLDRQALGMLGEIVPDREIVGVHAPTLNWAGGGLHCVTQPLPAV